MSSGSLVKNLLICSALVSCIHAVRTNLKPRSLEMGSSKLKPRPLVINNANVPLVVYLERGFLFNKQVINPGEAVNLWTPNNGPTILPFSIIALVGDEKSVPTEIDSLRNFVGMSAVPTAFIGGTIVSVVSWGALTGPAAALVPLVSKVAFAGYTLGAIDIAAGVAAAGGAREIAKKIIVNHPKSFMTKVRHIIPGIKYFAVSGGPHVDGKVEDLKINEIDSAEYAEYNISTVKNCISVQGHTFVKKVAFEIESCGDVRARGEWTQYGIRNGRPKYKHVDNSELKIRWESSMKIWQMIYISSYWSRSVLYTSKENMGEVPLSGWEPVDAGLPMPAIRMVSESEAEGIMTTPVTEDDADDGLDTDDEDLGED